MEFTVYTHFNGITFNFNQLLAFFKNLFLKKTFKQGIKETF